MISESPTKSTGYISTLTKDGMLTTLHSIINTYIGKTGLPKNTNKYADLDTVSHSKLLLSLIQTELNSEEEYMIPIEQYVNKCIREGRNANIITKFVQTAVNSVLHLFNKYEIESKSFVEHVNSYDYNSIDTIGRLYLKVVLASLYTKLKNPNSKITYSNINSRFNITNKLHSSISTIMDDSDAIENHKKLYYKTNKKFTDAVYSFDVLIANNKHKLDIFIKSITKDYEKIKIDLSEAYPTFTDLNLFLKYYQNVYINSSTKHCIQVIKYTVASLVFGLSLIYFFIPVSSLFQANYYTTNAIQSAIDWKVISSWKFAESAENSLIILNKILDIFKTYFPDKIHSNLKYLYSEKYVSLTNEITLVIFENIQKIFTNIDGSTLSTIDLVLKWLTIFSGSVFGLLSFYIASPSPLAHSNSIKLIKKYKLINTLYQNDLDELSILYNTYNSSKKLKDLENLYDYYVENIVELSKHNLQTGQLVQMKYNPEIIRLNDLINTYEKQRFDLLIDSVSKKV